MGAQTFRNYRLVLPVYYYGLMGNFYAMIIATGFSNAIYDTNDLSTIRGGSRALLNGPREIFRVLRDIGNGGTGGVETVGSKPESFKLTKLVDDASELLFAVEGFSGTAGEFDALIAKTFAGLQQFPAGDSALDLIGDGPGDTPDILAHLMPHVPHFWAVCEATGSVSQDWTGLRNSIVTRQLRAAGTDLPPPALAFNDPVHDEWDGFRPCAIDGFRPRNAIYFLPGDEQDGRVACSLFTGLRRKFGRGSRRKDYFREQFGMEIDQLAGRCISFADHFGEIVENPPEGVSEIAGAKMCVLYFDGNGFGAFTERAAGQGRDVLAAQAQSLRERRIEMMQNLLAKWVRDDDFLSFDPKRKTQDGERRSLPVFRFEILLWGGDEAVIVFPAWCLEKVLADLNKELSCGWELDEQGKPLSHALGLVVCSHKFPVRDVRNLAEQLANSCKAARGGREKNLLQYLNLQGTLDMPTREIDRERDAILGVKKECQEDFFTLELSRLPEILSGFAAVRGVSGDRDQGLPRGKLIEHHHELVDLGDLASNDPDTIGIVRTQIEKLIEANENRANITVDMVLPETIEGSGSPLAGLHHCVKLWGILAGISRQVPDPGGEEEVHASLEVEPVA